MFKNPFSFSGRIRRLEYGISYLICFVFNLVVLIFSAASPIFLLGLIPSIWFALAQGTKRCHDRGNMGIFMIIPFYIFWMWFAEGDIGPNKYGPDPKVR